MSRTSRADAPRFGSLAPRFPRLSQEGTGMAASSVAFSVDAGNEHRGRSDPASQPLTARLRGGPPGSEPRDTGMSPLIWR